MGKTTLRYVTQIPKANRRWRWSTGLGLAPKSFKQLLSCGWSAIFWTHHGLDNVYFYLLQHAAHSALHINYTNLKTKILIKVSTALHPDILSHTINADPRACLQSNHQYSLQLEKAQRDRRSFWGQVDERHGRGHLWKVSTTQPLGCDCRASEPRDSGRTAERLDAGRAEKAEYRTPCFGYHHIKLTGTGIWRNQLSALVSFVSICIVSTICWASSWEMQQRNTKPDNNGPPWSREVREKGKQEETWRLSWELESDLPYWLSSP